MSLGFGVWGLVQKTNLQTPNAKLWTADYILSAAATIRAAYAVGDSSSVLPGQTVVADSIPENEWRETQKKARALLAAAEQVHAGLDLPLA